MLCQPAFRLRFSLLIELELLDFQLLLAHGRLLLLNRDQFLLLNGLDVLVLAHQVLALRKPRKQRVSVLFFPLHNMMLVRVRNVLQTRRALAQRKNFA